MHRYDVRNKSRSNKSHADISLLAHAHSLVKLVTVTRTRRMLPVSQKLMPKSNACLKTPWLCSSFKAHYYSSFDAATWQTLR
jgi:hypothetical protein